MTTTPRCIATVAALLASFGSAFDNSTWYKRYPDYPEYCSTPEEMQRRAVPSLQEDSRVGETRLIHVTSVIRHGARTPYASGLDCWDGYWTNPETGVWDCNLTTILAPPLEATRDTSVMFLFEKKYDALQPPLANELNGTCQVGQLLLRGFQQELQNGNHLRKAYVYDGSNMNHDVRMRLLDTSSSGTLFQELYYRSDDDQRTLMSGQVLLTGLFGEELLDHAKQNASHPVIPLHTADRKRDILTGEDALCPRLTELQDEAKASQEYKDYEKSDEVQLLRTFMEKELGRVMENDAIDCTMTTICTDRPLPLALDDYGRAPNATPYHKTYGENLLKRVYESNVMSWAIPWRHNDGAYTKLAMGPLWAEIMDNIRPIISKQDPPPNKLALVSAHDTTLAPLLVSLGPRVWDGQWPPYASMIIIEIHEIIGGGTDRSIYKSDFAFRLLFNGKVLTSNMDGCPAEADLCDVQILVDRVTPFATRDRNCTARDQKSRPALEESKKLLSTSGGVVLVLTVVIVSGLLGSLATLYVMRGLPFQKRKDTAGMMTLPHSANDISSHHDEIDGADEAVQLT